jgi:hypothetical protein
MLKMDHALAWAAHLTGAVFMLVALLKTGRTKPNNDQRLENLARYIIRAFFSQERMTYNIASKDTPDGHAKVIYRSKDGRASKTFEALDWLAQLVTHNPNKGEQMVRYYGYYSNKSRGITTARHNSMIRIPPPL